ncbi:MAG TPA: hypothetical protein VG370_12745 [Chloroflexota bacterium]|nr:hypothetical protein [Chloroflexota bacterium]
MRAQLLLLLLLAAAACRAGAATPPGPSPVTSAGDPAGPIPFVWSTHTSHRPDGHRLRLQGGTLHAVPGELRLVDPAGRVVSSVALSPRLGAQHGLCGQGVGVVQVDLPLPASELGSFRDGAWPPGYRVEAEVGGAWRPTELAFAGCASIE